MSKDKIIFQENVQARELNRYKFANKNDTLKQLQRRDECNISEKYTRKRRKKKNLITHKIYYIKSSIQCNLSYSKPYSHKLLQNGC